MRVIGETIFDILYIIIIIFLGTKLSCNYKNKTGKLMGFAIILLGVGDAFHLFPRILSYFLSYNFNSLLGIGKLVTSITMSIFYIFLYYSFLDCYNEKKNVALDIFMWLLFISRIILCFLPENDWLNNGSSEFYGIVRNIPFWMMGLVVIFLFFKNRKENKSLKYLWFIIFLSFLFYTPVVLYSKSVKMIGMLMIPKTICYIIIAYLFLKNNKEIS